MSDDPMVQLRIVDEPATPDPRFVARLRAQLVAALDMPTVPLPERSPVVTDTAAAPTTTSITPYICVSPAVDALAWYADVFGAVETVRYTADDGRIGHAEITVAGARLMLSDEYPDLGVVAPTTLGGTASTLHVTVSDVDATYERFVAAGGRPAEPPQDKEYGARSFTALDPFGHRWMVQTPTGRISETEGYTITTSAPSRPVVELGYVTLALPDTAAAGRFYGELFGWIAEQGNAGEGYAHVGNTELPLGLTPGPAGESPELYFRVDDAAAYAARVLELGGEVISETVYDSGPNVVCRDDQGRRFQLWQPAPGYE